MQGLYEIEKASAKVWEGCMHPSRRARGQRSPEPMLLSCINRLLPQLATATIHSAHETLNLRQRGNGGCYPPFWQDCSQKGMCFVLENMDEHQYKGQQHILQPERSRQKGNAPSTMYFIVAGGGGGAIAPSAPPRFRRLCTCNRYIILCMYAYA